MSNTAQRLRLVGVGVGMVYAGLCLLVVAILFLVAGPLLLGRVQFGLALVVLSLGLSMVVLVLSTIGRFFCLAMPTGPTGTLFIIYSAVVLDLVALGLTGLQVLKPFVPGLVLPSIVDQLTMPMSVAGSIFFILFLHNLARAVQRTDLAGMALLVLALGVVVIVGITLVTVFDFRTRGAGLPYMEWGLGLLAISVFVLYGNLLTYLRKAVNVFASRLPEEVEPAI